MKKALGAVVLLLPALVLADVTVPDTPAGRALGAFIDTLNSDDPAAAQSFLTSHPSWMTVDSIANWKAGVGGYDLLEIYPGTPTNVFFRVRQKRWSVEEVGRLEVNARDMVSLEALGAWRIPPGATFEAVTLDDKTRGALLERAAGTLEKFHIDPVTGRKLSTYLRKQSAHGEYRGIAYGEVLARKVTQDLREFGHDDHLELRFSYALKPAKPSPQQAEQDARRMAAANCGFVKAEHLRPNVGYLKFDFFGDPEICAPTATAAMAFLADSDALIFDLRDNNGGRGGIGTLLASYLFAERTHLSDGYRRADNVTTEEWTLPYVPGRKFIDKPVVVLISKKTFSAGEGFTYVLQSLKRATVVGETTAGGSGTIEFKALDEHFTLVVPTGRVTSPANRASFDRTGVVPDVKVPADQALDAAMKLVAP
jgi:hypothetical protein